MIVKIMVMMIDKDDLPSEAQNERSNDMEPGNNREEISGKRFLEVLFGILWFVFVWYGKVTYGTRRHQSRNSLLPVSVGAKDSHGNEYDDQERPC